MSDNHPQIEIQITPAVFGTKVLVDGVELLPMKDAALSCLVSEVQQYTKEEKKDG